MLKQQLGVDQSTLAKPAFNPDAVEFSNLELTRVNVTGEDWLPSKDLDSVDPELLEGVESVLDRNLGNETGAFIYIGRNEFELVSTNEASLFRAERREEFEKNALDAITKPLKVDPKLSNCVIIAGRTSRALARAVGQELGIKIEGGLCTSFANGETRIEIPDNVRDRDVFVIQSVSDPVNDSLVELGLTIDALRRAQAKSVTAVIPYFGYSRQDTKGKVLGPISARWVADLYENSGVDRVVTVDIHARQIDGFFKCPLENLVGFPILVPHLIKKYGTERITIVSPDTGGMPRAEWAAECLMRYAPEDLPSHNVAVECMYKARARPNEVKKMRLTGDGANIKDAVCVLTDDMFDTGDTMIKAAKILRENGAKKVVALATHPACSKNCIEKFRNATGSDGKQLFDEIIVTDTIPLRRAKGDLITVISVKELLSEAIKRICSGDASSLLNLQDFYGHANTQ